MLDTLRDSAPTTDDLALAPEAAETDLLDRAADNMEKGRAAYDELNYAAAGLLFAASQAQSAIAQARATARLADATEKVARATRMSSYKS